MLPKFSKEIDDEFLERTTGNVPQCTACRLAVLIDVAAGVIEVRIAVGVFLASRFGNEVLVTVVTLENTLEQHLVAVSPTCC